MSQQERVYYLLEAYTSRKATREEEQELMQWLDEAEEGSDLKEFINAQWNKCSQENEPAHVDWEKMFDNIVKSDDTFYIAPVVTRGRIFWTRIAAAASVLLVVASATYMFVHAKSGNQTTAAVKQQPQSNNDILPAKQQVILTLADGSTKILDSLTNGTITVQGKTNAVKDSGSISYIHNQSTEVEYNTVATEKGRMYHLQLADGTEVWLDALSSVHFPTSFSGGERVVDITGQAYFEVAKNPNKPFKVKSGNQVIEVLGTHFNVNSHNQQAIQTTLLEGLIKLSTDQSPVKVFVKPGQQANSNNLGVIQVWDGIDLDAVMAWKNGYFYFDKANIKTVMTEVSRWYDVDISYEGNNNEIFSGKIDRSLNLRDLLDGLLETRGHYRINNNKVTILP